MLRPISSPATMTRQAAFKNGSQNVSRRGNIRARTALAAEPTEQLLIADGRGGKKRSPWDTVGCFSLHSAGGGKRRRHRQNMPCYYSRKPFLPLRSQKKKKNEATCIQTLKTKTNLEREEGGGRAAAAKGLLLLGGAELLHGLFYFVAWHHGMERLQRSF